MGRSRERKTPGPPSRGPGERADPDGPAARPVSPVVSPAGDLLPHLWRFHNQFRDGNDADKVLRAALRLGLDLFRASEGCAVAVKPGADEARVLFGIPNDGQWDRTLLADFLHGEKVTVPPELMLARVRRFGRMWGALAVRAPATTYHWDARQGFSSIGALANEVIERIDRERVREVRERVDRKVLEQSHPKHLFYEVLHGLRSLTAYDHSAALLMYDPERDALEVVAEQIAWQKAKGRNVGRTLAPVGPLRESLRTGEVRGFDRSGRHWTNWTGQDAVELAELLDFDPSDGQSTPPEGAMLCAPLVTRGELLGVLKVAARGPGTFCRYEVALVTQFLPQAAVALQNARRAESLEEKVLAAERKHAMADLARGVAHDVNNTLGGVLPLVQQLREEFASGGPDPAEVTEDLREIERAIQVCRRIFGGMLGFARGQARNPSDVSIRQAAEGALAILRQSLDRRGVGLLVDVPHDLPGLFGVQGDVEQLLLNLLSNARDASSAGDMLTLRAGLDGDGLIELVVEDTGCGISREHLPRVQEPFYTTKAEGNGLGLAICRSIVSQMRGNLRIESTPGEGTRVCATFPAREELTT